MKSTLLSLILIAGLSTGLFAQRTITNEKHKRVLSHVEANIFNVQFFNSDGELVQEGQYWRDGDLFKPHGNWVLYSEINGEVTTTSTFDKGERLSVQTTIDGEIVKADKQMLSIRNIENQIDQLEKKLADLKHN